MHKWFHILAVEQEKGVTIGCSDDPPSAVKTANI